MADGKDIEQKIKLTYETNAKKTAKDIGKLDKGIGKATDSQDKHTKSTKKSTKGLEDLGGGIGSTIKGFKGMIKQMWLMVANPIGLVIAAIALALVAVTKAFTSTKAGGEKVDQIMAGLSATIDVLRDRVLKVAGAIWKFIKGDWKGAMAAGKEAVSGFGAEVAKEFKQAADAVKSLQEVDDAMRKLGVTRAKLNRDLVEAKEVIESSTSSYKEKLDAIEKVTKSEEEQTSKELENARKKYEAIKLQNSLSDSSKEALEAEADAEANLYNIQEKSARDRIKNIKLLEQTEIDEKSRRKAIYDERKKQTEEEQKEADRLYKEAYDKEQEDINRRIASEEAERIAIIENNKFLREIAEEEEAEEIAAEERRLARLQKAADAELQIEKDKLAQKKAIKDAEGNLINQALNFISTMFGKSKAIQKGIIGAEAAVSIGKMVASNNAANIGALATPQAIATSGAAAQPVIALNNISTGLGIASTVAATAKAMKSLGGGSAPSAGSRASSGGSSAAPQTGFQSSSENQISTSISSGINTQEPVKAYVLESDVTTAQALTRNKIENNSL